VADREHQRGLILAVAAYGAWGLFPLFWKQLGHTPALEQLAHRIWWALVVYMLLLLGLGQVRDWWAAMRDRKNRRVLAATAALISVNWFLYIYAIEQGMILQASLGYFINPLVNVLMGVIFLGERLRRAQQIAVGLALVGIIIMGSGASSAIWLSLCLAFSFGTYGLLRKTAAVGALTGAATEALILAPLCLAYIFSIEADGSGHFTSVDTRTTALFLVTGLVTAAPLLCFAGAARRIPLSTLGFVQYLAPTGQFLLAVFVYDEAIDSSRLAAFCFIWVALGILVGEGLTRRSELPQRSA
jgi:chloramphenicol-sensitive protein RarD